MLVWRRILVPTDFSETSEAAVRQGVDLARTFNASVILLYVGDGPASESATDFPLGIDADAGVPLAREGIGLLDQGLVRHDPLVLSATPGRRATPRKT